MRTLASLSIAPAAAVELPSNTEGEPLRATLSLLLVLLVLTGCVDDGTEGPLAESDFPDVTCTVAYRESVTVDLSSEQVLLTPGDARNLGYEHLQVSLNYIFGAGEGGSLLVEAAGADGESLFARDLYQFLPGEPPSGDYPGSHGFTGLNYVYPPGTTAEGQFFCEAEGP